MSPAPIIKDRPIIIMPLEDIKPYEKNPRKNDQAVPAVMNSIKRFGFRGAILVDPDLVIIAGHTRYKAAKKLKLKEVPVQIIDDLTPEEITAYRIADNSTADLAEWDFSLLAEEAENIGDIDLADFGLNIEEVYLDTPEALEEIEEDEPPAPSEIPTTKPGQIFRLGPHTLMCGDATSTNDVDTLIRAAGGGPIDMLLTDPPYNVAIEGETEEHLTIQNDDMDYSIFRDFLTKAFNNAADHLKAGGVFYIWHACWTSLEFQHAVQDAGLKIRQTLVWVKNVFVLGRQDYQWKQEPCLYGWKEGAPHYFINDRTRTTVAEDPLDPDSMTEDQLRETLKHILAETPTDVIHAAKPSASRLHPTMKPVALLARLIYNSTHPGETILDLFGGSGSSIMACEQLHRRCVMMELDPHYCDVIIKRYEEQTGKKVQEVKI